MKKTKVIEFMLNIGDGGAETLVKDYALLMDKSQFEVTVVVLHEIEDSANMRILQANGIPVIALSSENDLFKKLWRFFFKPANAELIPDSMKEEEEKESEPSFLRKLVSRCRNKFFGWKLLHIARKNGAQVIHGHLEVLEIMAAVSRELKSLRLLHTCHNLPELVYFSQERKAAEKLIRNNSMQLIALHGEMSRELNEMFGIDNTVIIRNGIDLQRFLQPGITKEEKRRELNIPENAFLVGHVGRFAVQKNHPFLIDVFREIARKKENAYLLMIGAGDHSHIEKQLAEYGLSDRYQILSGRKDINELLTAMDVFVFPSIFEGLPVSMVEAQASGLRCLISDRCNLEVICSETCIPLPLEDPANWADAALDTTLRYSPEHLLSDYDMKKEIRRLEQLYLGKQNGCL